MIRIKARDERIPRRSGTYAAGRHEERNEADGPFSAPDYEVMMTFVPTRTSGYTVAIPTLDSRMQP